MPVAVLGFDGFRERRPATFHPAGACANRTRVCRPAGTRDARNGKRSRDGVCRQRHGDAEEVRPVPGTHSRNDDQERNESGEVAPIPGLLEWRLRPDGGAEPGPEITGLVCWMPRALMLFCPFR